MPLGPRRARAVWAARMAAASRARRAVMSTVRRGGSAVLNVDESGEVWKEMRLKDAICEMGMRR